MAAVQSIEGRLAIFAAAVFLPGVLALAVLLGLNIFEVRRAQEFALLASARSASAAVDLQLATLSATAETLAESDAVAAGDWARLDRRIERAELPAGVLARVGGADGPFPGPPAPSAGSAAQQADPVAQSASHPRSAHQRTTVSDLVAGPDGPPAVVISAPAPDTTRDVVVQLWIDPRIFLSEQASWGLPDAAMVTLVDTRRHVVSRSRHFERFVGRSATEPMIAAMTEAPEGVTASRSFEGLPTVVAYHQSRLSGWTTMVVMPRAFVLQPVWLNALALILLLAALGAASLWAARRQSQALSADIRALEQDARSIAAGRLVARQPVRVVNLDRIQAALSEASAELLRRQERQMLLINELNHRVKNTLATIQSLSAQTFRGAERELQSKFEQRLGALAAAHDLLTQTTWSAVDIRQVAARCGGPSGPEQVCMTGPSVLLPPEAALALCMCLHELTTNSLKYGALSRPQGRVDLTWTLEGEEVALTWRERGGPPVRPPERTGFGSRLIDRLVKHELNGGLERDFRPDGLIVVGRFKPGPNARWNSTL
ncbi:sensor histidine kinase [Brevundimonas sp. S30B]|uniref:sensor histidine kinase n=1 Tax=unclassified Brevundimonas TaxID=2622653 RepID=UPI00107267AE|nr:MULTISPECIES: HWE histidine kinase domain-containing protein [unclassified Brevundimonas]QBX38089.1 sensor histidine kinase [Brevundimonas sp. MF30-B]TFW02557.1 sensor histidine kinase [Brevundimonas sp. S30B]